MESIGEKNKKGRKHNPATKAVSPVRPPTLTPAAAIIAGLTTNNTKRCQKFIALEIPTAGNLLQLAPGLGPVFEQCPRETRVQCPVLLSPRYQSASPHN